MSIPLWLQCTHLLMATSSRIMHHVTKLKSSQTGFLNMTMSSLYQMASTVTRSLSNRAHAGRNYRNCVMLSCQYGPKSPSDVSNLLHLYHEELRRSEDKRGSNPGNSKVFLIKCSVSVIYWYCLESSPVRRVVWYEKICFLLNNNNKKHICG